MSEEINEMTQAQWDRIANKNADVIQKMIDCFNNSDGPGLFELIDDDIDFRMIGTTPFSGRFKGKKAYMENMEKVMEYLEPKITLTIDNLIPAGDWVVTEFRGDTMTKAGVPYCNTYCQVYKIKDGKIVYQAEYMDTQLVMDVIFPEK